jgi:hypothetical protein
MPKVKTQIKFKIDDEIVSAFKAHCASEGVSMTSVVEDWMKTRKPVKDVKIMTLTRRERKKSVIAMIGLLNDILENEGQYRDSIPEQFTNRFEEAEHFCEKLAEAIECLEDVF